MTTENSNPDNLPPSEEDSYQAKFQGKDIVSWHDAKTKRIDDASVIEVYSVQLSDERIIAVGEIEDADAVSVRFLSPTEDGKISNLNFALSYEAAMALHILLGKKLRDILIEPLPETVGDTPQN